MTKGANYLGLSIVIAALAIAFLYFEKYLNLAPCPLCIVDRLILGVMAIVFIGAIFHNRRAVVYYIINLLLSLCGMAVAARHIWLQNNLEQAASCTADTGYLFNILPASEFIQHIFNTGVDCGKVEWTLLGGSIAQLTAILFAALAVFISIMLYNSWNKYQQDQFNRLR
jgi:protein dithiol:quinone oxidoreductase